MRLIPVLDVFDTVAVRGVGGRRNEYRPLVTQLCEGSDPLTVAAAYRARLNTPALYLADLDAILHRRPNTALYRDLLERDTELWLDAGVQCPADVAPLLDLGVPTIIVGLESWRSPSEMTALAMSVPRERLLFSLDLRNGQPCGGVDWSDDPSVIMDTVLVTGIDRFLILDLHDVGQHTGGSTAALCRALRERSPTAEIITGGGIRNEDDIRRWEQHGIDGLLIASAIHDGHLHLADPTKD